ncbi:LisH domain-containing protein [Caenorhabditis elegans]|uniref:LisH domain-containing protein n=1 Tax=Caenorhabditis elegans TaxID=6239 RepID=Q20424_CAEEL|nr:LisH domain-containing protein [Caenorhabditis elegans]CAB01504.2 LisH domain-containing protein [Caenorhabditis elegans]|eukprot:NP_506140.2 Uncharacterized protein CELE_F45D3.1 [Caenorhabditis elegans]
MGFQKCSEKSVKNYAVLLESENLNIVRCAVKWLLESDVSLELLIKYDIGNLVEKKFLITDKLARNLILKIRNLEEEEFGDNDIEMFITPNSSLKHNSSPESLNNSDFSFRLTNLSPIEKSDINPSRKSKKSRGPVRNLKMQIMEEHIRSE